jgi:hypothetical protein
VFKEKVGISDHETTTNLILIGRISVLEQQVAYLARKISDTSDDPIADLRMADDLKRITNGVFTEIEDDPYGFLGKHL